MRRILLFKRRGRPAAGGCYTEPAYSTNGSTYGTQIGYASPYYDNGYYPYGGY